MGSRRAPLAPADSPGAEANALLADGPRPLVGKGQSGTGWVDRTGRRSGGYRHGPVGGQFVPRCQSGRRSVGELFEVEQPNIFAVVVDVEFDGEGWALEHASGPIELSGV